MVQRLLAALLLLTAALHVRAAVTVHPIFDNNMVLQRNQPISIWGRGNAGEQVAVSLGDKSVSTTVGSTGRWSVKLPAMVANKTPQTLTVNTRAFTNVLIGEVWILSGQSNMRLELGSIAGDDREYMKGLDVRLLKTAETRPSGGTIPEDNFFGGGAHSWTAMNPADKTTEKFSAIGLWFASRINRETDVPVGLILTAVGGSKLEAWTPLNALQASDSGQWIINYGKQVSSQYKPHDMAGVLYEYFTSALTPLSIGGYFWYQGESNSDAPICNYYEWNMKLFIDELRSRFVNAVPNLPILVMQVHPWGSSSRKLGESSRAVVREAQYNAFRARSNTGLVVILDAGDGNIHSSDKKRPGLRAGTQALVRWYNKSFPDWMSPFFAGMSRLQDSVLVSFDSHATGLKTTNGAEPTGFIVREKSADKFVVANARIKGNQVVVWSSAVKTINEVRYAWDDFPAVNLVNEHNLPVGQFMATEFGPVSAQAMLNARYSTNCTTAAATPWVYDIRGRRLQHASPNQTHPRAAGIYILPTGQRMLKP